MDAEQHRQLLDEAWRIVEEALMTGKITLSTREVIPLGTRRALDVLQAAKDLAKQRPIKQRRINIMEDYRPAVTDEG